MTLTPSNSPIPGNVLGDGLAVPFASLSIEVGLTVAGAGRESLSPTGRQRYRLVSVNALNGDWHVESRGANGSVRDIVVGSSYVVAVAGSLDANGYVDLTDDFMSGTGHRRIVGSLLAAAVAPDHALWWAREGDSLWLTIRRSGDKWSGTSSPVVA